MKVALVVVGLAAAAGVGAVAGILWVTKDMFAPLDPAR